MTEESFELYNLPTDIRKVGIWLLREHEGTLDPDRLTSLAFELTSALARGAAGHVAEFGTFKGASAAWLRLVLDFAGRGELDVHAFDSFEGLPKPSQIDGDYLAEGDVRSSVEEVLDLHDRLGLKAPIVHRGWFSETASELPKEVAFAYVDADFYESTLAATRALAPAMTPGSAIVIDDYANLRENPRAWDAMPGVKLACDEVLGAADVIVGKGDLAYGVVRFGMDRHNKWDV